jgi:single-stranded-DNA-specific exonuclease
MCHLGIERRNINTALIGFALTPRLNAAGRMGRTSLTVDLLLTEDDCEAEQLTTELCRLNDERRELGVGHLRTGLRIYLVNKPPKGRLSYRPRLVSGVMGIVAAKTAEQFLFPAIMITVDEDGVGRGPAGASGVPHILCAREMQRPARQFRRAREAAGLTIAEANVDEFRRRISSIIMSL